MAEALVSTMLEQLASIASQAIQQEVSLLMGVETEVEKLTGTLQTIKAVLLDAEKRQVMEEVVKDWLEKLKDVCYDIDGVLDEWSTAILRLQIERVENAPIVKKVRSYITSPCFCFNRVGVHHHIASKIKELNERLDVIASEKIKYNFKSITTTIEELERPKSTSFVDVSEVYGRDQDKKTIVSQLLCENSKKERGLHIISIVGMGGIGKTTLAQLAYNDDDVKAHFEKRIWVCVSDPFDEIRIGKAILKGLGESDPSSLDWENLPQCIHESIMGKKFLLVLDDVWTEDFKKWEPLEHSLRGGSQGSRILVTTRSKRVAKILGTTYTQSLEELSEKVCWSLFSQIAFFGRSRKECEKLEEIGRKIANKCKGLPLAAKTIGSLMRLKETEQDWRNVLDSEIWEIEEAKKGIFPALFLSYYDLPSALKRCFSYCSIFSKDDLIERDELIELWMAQGYLSSRQSMEMEITGREYFENLAMRSFFQDFEKDEKDGSITSCKMHDIFHDFAQFLTKNECFITEVAIGKESSMDPSHRRCRHSSIILPAKAQFPVSIYSRENLRTLLVDHGFNSKVDVDLPNLFHHLKFLRALDLSNTSIRKLPKEVGKLIHLRYLDLYLSDIEELPETLCDLCNLQTLDLSSCHSLMKLPKGMGKLINLRHLRISLDYNLRFLPKGIGRLSSLQELSNFIVSGDDEREACKLNDLKNLNNLKGSLTISKLGNVADAGEIGKAELKTKKHILDLHLEFNEHRGVIYDAIEALQPHPNLEILTMKFYGGFLFPNWMTSLTKLRKLRLFRFHNCEALPPLGQLPSLESLQLDGYNYQIRIVGVEFLGIRIDGSRSKDEGTDSTEASALIAFPKLKELIFTAMYEWEEWDLTIPTKKEEEEIILMPCLHSLTFEKCYQLKALPHHLQTMPLEKLFLRKCPILQERCQKGLGEDWAKISHIPNIFIGV